MKLELSVETFVVCVLLAKELEYSVQMCGLNSHHFFDTM